jgi:hypothetical protein
METQNTLEQVLVANNPAQDIFPDTSTFALMGVIFLLLIIVLVFGEVVKSVSRLPEHDGSKPRNLHQRLAQITMNFAPFWMPLVVFLLQFRLMDNQLLFSISLDADGIKHLCMIGFIVFELFVISRYSKVIYKYI